MGHLNGRAKDPVVVWEISILLGSEVRMGYWVVFKATEEEFGGCNKNKRSLILYLFFFDKECCHHFTMELDILEETGMTCCRPIITHMHSNVNLLPRQWYSHGDPTSMVILQV